MILQVEVYQFAPEKLPFDPKGRKGSSRLPVPSVLRGFHSLLNFGGATVNLGGPDSRYHPISSDAFFWNHFPPQKTSSFPWFLRVPSHHSKGFLGTKKFSFFFCRWHLFKKTPNNSKELLTPNLRVYLPTKTNPFRVCKKRWVEFPPLIFDGKKHDNQVGALWAASSLPFGHHLGTVEGKSVAKDVLVEVRWGEVTSDKFPQKNGRCKQSIPSLKLTVCPWK